MDSSLSDFLDSLIMLFDCLFLCVCSLSLFVFPFVPFVAICEEDASFRLLRLRE